MVRPLWHSDICTIHKIALQPVGNVVQQLYCVQLETKGVPIPEDGGTISDPELLMEVMEQRECIEETDDLAILQAMLQENKLLQQATTEKLSAAFGNNDLKEAQRVITDLRYVTRTGEAIAKKIPGG
ncbi:hypothetical protein ABBQ32_010291 [Trebouxia sp. C0010 RCD-2024]